MASLKPLMIAASVALGLSTAARGADTATTQDLAAQVKALQAKVDNLEGKTAASQAEVSATIDSVMKDADARSKSMALTGGMAGYDDTKGFVIQSANGDFSLHPWIQFMPRYVANYAKDGKGGGTADTTDDGFEIRRLKFGLDGKLYNNIEYLFLWNTLQHSGNLNLEQAWMKWSINDQFALRAGQIKDPFTHEGLISDTRLLTAERSYLVDVLAHNQNLVQGVSLIWNAGDLRAEVAFTDGIGSQNTNFQNNNGDPTVVGPNFGLAGRAEYKLFGNWNQYDDFTALGNDKDMLVVGGGLDVTETGSRDDWRHTVDGQWETGPLSVYGAYIGDWVHNGPGGDSYNFGVMAQAGYLLNKQWEAFGRFDWTHFDKKTAPGTRNVTEFTAGVNYYMHKHNAKFTVEAVYLPKGAPIADDLSDVIANDGHTEILLRAQFQLVL